MCLMKFVFITEISKMFFYMFQEKRAIHGLCRGIKQSKERLFNLQEDFMDIGHPEFCHSANSLTLNTVYSFVHKKSFIGIIYRR